MYFAIQGRSIARYKLQTPNDSPILFKLLPPVNEYINFSQYDRYITIPAHAIPYRALLFRLLALGDLISVGLALSLSLFFPPWTLCGLLASATTLVRSACKTRSVDCKAWIISPSRSWRAFIWADLGGADFCWAWRDCTVERALRREWEADNFKY
jgi:hypothetical protein